MLSPTSREKLSKKLTKTKESFGSFLFLLTLIRLASSPMTLLLSIISPDLSLKSFFNLRVSIGSCIVVTSRLVVGHIIIFDPYP
ncbi:hypothetical protein BO83DRAFT_177686 [Aspergillus eucalypticola CBS 122712]|uniref:Uncharacterized protein n=1 Tax=Aspergillus eucalypticola (strain CBS 122712 / IBT 29274) TaxID=1448314 RepID=A0A317W816_ASPEC|nr:uncharacterized protein BO83DRAFT_177686 [Aspergillus eucalypticola CBS 122712]PWY81447.1 hypothetical protein BO83DRAFT_177686 [Aspergillus eucalypticola CBS 122712]